MKVFERMSCGAARLWMVGLLGGMLAGCGSVQYSDPVNPKRPYTFPGQAQTAPAASPVVSAPAPIVSSSSPALPGLANPAPAPAAVVSAPAPASVAVTPATVAPVEPAPVPMPVVVTPVIAPAPQPVVESQAPAPAAPAPAAPPVVVGKSSPVAPAKDNAAPTSPSSIVLQPGDNLVVSFSDLPPQMSLLPVQAELGADGKLTLHHNVQVYAVGKTPRQLEQEIRSEYVPKFYKYLTITIKTEMRFFHVNGEVRLPSQYPWRGQTTVLKAVAAGGGFTDWARQTKVQLTRVNGQQFTINCKDALEKPDKDLPVYPGDIVYVPRKGIWGF